MMKMDKLSLVIIVLIGLSWPMDNVNYTYTKEELMGKVSPKRDSDFVRVEAKYANRAGMYLQKDAYNAFIRMYQAAKREHISLKIVSAFRSFYHQKYIWEAKWTGKRKVDGQNLSQSIPDAFLRAKKILLYSSMPGSSRHHWGTEVDLNELDNEYFSHGEGKRIYNWLENHAAEYGFCQPYTANRSFGYQEEKWHWSYLPLAKSMLLAYQKLIRIDDFKGFLGAEEADSVHIISHYVLGINKQCK